MTADLGAQLAEDLKTGFTALVAAHQSAVYTTLLRWGTGAADAEELTQETFLRAFRSLEAWEPDRRRTLAPRPFLLRIAINAAHTRRRQTSRRPGETALDPNLRSPGGGPEAGALAADDRATLLRALQELPATQSLAVVLRHVTGLTYPEIAEVLDVPLGTAKAHVHRGLRRLQTRLIDPRKEDSQ